MAALLIMIGAGGHAAVVLDAAKLSDMHVHACLDDNSALIGAEIEGVQVQAQTGLEALISAGAKFHVAIGANAVRARLQIKFTQAGLEPFTVIHPLASVARTADVGAGSFVTAGAIIAPRACVGAGSIINHRAVVDHDGRIGTFTHIAPGAVLGGAVTVGDRTLVGAGAVVLPGLYIGANCIIGAGAVVTRDVPEGATVTGVPARIT